MIALSYVLFGNILCSGNQTGSEASGAYINVTGSTVLQNLYSLNIGLPSSVGSSV